MLNFLDKQVMSKPIEVPDVVKLKTARQDFRDLQRKSAIEQAKREALKPDGSLDQSKLRTTLIEKGFGENVDDVVNYIAKEREAAAQLVSEGKRRDMMDIALGLSTPEQVEEYRNGKTTVTANPVYPGKPSGVTGDYDLTKDPDIPGYIPQTSSPEKKVGENEILVTGSVKNPQEMKLPDIIPQQEYTIKSGSPQLSPQYLSSDVDWSKFVPGASSEEQSRGNTQYQLPSDKKERELAIKTASIVFGIDFDPNNPNVGQQIDNAATLRAESEVKPVISQAYKDPFEYWKDKAARPSEVAKKRAEYLSKFEAGRSSLIGQGLQERSTATGERSQALTEKKAEPLFPEKNNKLSRVVTESELSKINNILPAYDDLRAARNALANAKGNYLPALYTAAAAYLRANGQPVTNEAVNTFIVGSGVIPNADELQLKNTITSTTPYTDLLKTEFFRKTGLGTSNTKPNLEKFDTYLENTEGDFISSGGNPDYIKMSPSERKLRGKAGSKKEKPKTTKSGKPVESF